MTNINPEVLDRATIDLIFALRDSLTDDGPSRLDFWSGGRASTALETAAAGASTASEALTIAARKLQIPQIVAAQAKNVVRACEVIDQDYEAWAGHVARNIVYIVALADVERLERRAARKAEKEAEALDDPNF
ncbi:hypothetical protein ACU19_04815 [Actinobaculum suis]|uniref:hypothetical protein n=1 Tax=Actinobaculum suis TaxID=1657 RepID=UPI00066FDEC4|nr:hypothetical protein [Actinobaculum suis]KMY23300.1 hypothetical protein ACU19_04815 [Actinobaculum suis]